MKLRFKSVRLEELYTNERGAHKYPKSVVNNFFEEVFGIDAGFWLNLEANYRLHLARAARMKRKAG